MISANLTQGNNRGKNLTGKEQDVFLERLNNGRIYFKRLSGSRVALQEGKSVVQILGRAPQMMDFKMGSSRVGAQGGIALAEGLRAGGLRDPRSLLPHFNF